MVLSTKAREASPSASPRPAERAENIFENSPFPSFSISWRPTLFAHFYFLNSGFPAFLLLRPPLPHRFSWWPCQIWKASNISKVVKVVQDHVWVTFSLGGQSGVGTRESISLKGWSGFVLGDVFPSEAVRGPMLVMVFPRRKEMKLTRLSHLLSFASLFTIYKGVISVHFAFVFPF